MIAHQFKDMGFFQRTLIKTIAMTHTITMSDDLTVMRSKTPSMPTYCCYCMRVFYYYYYYYYYYYLAVSSREQFGPVVYAFTGTKDNKVGQVDLPYEYFLWSSLW